jgi:predicted RNA-binding protein associated with RNAse of E/G family
MLSRPGADPPHVTIRYLRPPDRVELFVQSLVHADAEVKITLARGLSLDVPLRIGDRVALEKGSDALWFTFPGAWHDIGRFHRADGTLTGIYANVISPCEFRSPELWETTDLFLDLWIPAEGRRGSGGGDAAVLLLDEDELDEAEAKGWLDRATATRARVEAARLLEAAADGVWPPPVVEEWTRERALARLLERGE